MSLLSRMFTRKAATEERERAARELAEREALKRSLAQKFSSTLKISELNDTPDHRTYSNKILGLVRNAIPHEVNCDSLDFPDIPESGLPGVKFRPLLVLIIKKILRLAIYRNKDQEMGLRGWTKYDQLMRSSYSKCTQTILKGNIELYKRANLRFEGDLYEDAKTFFQWLNNPDDYRELSDIPELLNNPMYGNYVSLAGYIAFGYHISNRDWFEWSGDLSKGNATITGIRPTYIDRTYCDCQALDAVSCPASLPEEMTPAQKTAKKTELGLLSVQGIAKEPFLRLPAAARAVGGKKTKKSNNKRKHRNSRKTQ